jgi:hypothetical protein
MVDTATFEMNNNIFKNDLVEELSIQSNDYGSFIKVGSYNSSFDSSYEKSENLLVDQEIQINLNKENELKESEKELEEINNTRINKSKRSKSTIIQKTLN